MIWSFGIRTQRHSSFRLSPFSKIAIPVIETIHYSHSPSRKQLLLIVPTRAAEIMLIKKHVLLFYSSSFLSSRLLSWNKFGWIERKLWKSPIGMFVSVLRKSSLTLIHSLRFDSIEIAGVCGIVSWCTVFPSTVPITRKRESIVTRHRQDTFTEHITQIPKPSTNRLVPIGRLNGAAFV